MPGSWGVDVGVIVEVIGDGNGDVSP